MGRQESNNVQINISIPMEWKIELENLVRIYSVEEGETITFLDLMRRGIQEKYHSASHCKYPTQYHIIRCPKFRFCRNLNRSSKNAHRLNEQNLPYGISLHDIYHHLLQSKNHEALETFHKVLRL